MFSIGAYKNILSPNKTNYVVKDLPITNKCVFIEVS